MPTALIIRASVNLSAENESVLPTTRADITFASVLYPNAKSELMLFVNFYTAALVLSEISLLTAAHSV